MFWIIIFWWVNCLFWFIVCDVCWKCVLKGLSEVFYDDSVGDL